MLELKHFRRWGAVRLRMTLWNVPVLAALIAGALGGVVRYKITGPRITLDSRPRLRD